MKSLKETEKISFQQLENIANGTGDEKVAIPDSMDEKIETAILASAMVEKETHNSTKHSRRVSFWMVVPACVAATAVAIGIFLFSSKETVIQDTYDDPYLAYAEVESVLEYMSSKMDKGRTGLEELDSATEKVIETLKRL